MSRAILPVDLAERVSQLERQIAALERSPQLGHSSIKDGALKALDAANNVTISMGSDGSIRAFDTSGNLLCLLGNAGITVYDTGGHPLVVLGKLPGGSYGIQVSSATGYHQLLMDNNGAGLPFMVTPARDVNSGFHAVNWLTLADVYGTEVELLQWDSLMVKIGWATGASAGSLRVQASNAIGTPSTATVALPSGSSGDQNFSWLHGLALGAGPYYFAVQASTALAINPVSIYSPDGGFVFYRGTEMFPLSTATGI